MDGLSELDRTELLAEARRFRWMMRTCQALLKSRTRELRKVKEDLSAAQRRIKELEEARK